MKTAICLVVKDEEVEITYWLAWHKALGFDTFIIYDDYSSDATEAVILSLQGVFDIRYHRNAVNRDLHNIRQVRAYNNAAIKYRSEFDWIALFDADEYLSLNGKTISEYLEDKTDADCIAFNWCCAGTNGYISRPSGLPVLAYPSHGSEELFWNRHTKVMFRPTALSEPIYQVHNVPVRGPSITANGEPVEWTEASGGFTKNAPDWSQGRLFHYQSRSMEHYIKRDRHLKDLRRAEGDPLHDITKKTEYSAVSSTAPENYITSYYEWMLKVRAAQSRYIAQTLRGTSDSLVSGLNTLFAAPNVPIFDPAYIPAAHEVAHNWISFHSRPGNILRHFPGGEQTYIFFHIKNHFDDFLLQKDGQIQTSPHGDADARIIGLYIRETSHVHLFSPDGTPLIFNRDPRVSPILTYTAWNNDDGTFSLSHPRTHRYLNFVPSGEHTVGRIRAFAWESFKAIPLDPSKVSSELETAAQYLATNDSLTAILQNTRCPGANNALIVNALSTLSETELKSARLLTHNILQEHLI